MSFFVFTTWGNAGENIVYNGCTNVLPSLYYNVEPTMRQRSKLHWPNVVFHPWGIVVYNVEPTLDQRMNTIWEDFFPVRGSERMTEQYDDCRCGYGLVETEMHVLFE